MSIDLTNIDSPRFEFTGKNPNGSTFTISLDLDWIGPELQSRIPTAFQPFGELDGESNPVMGLTVIMNSYMNGKPLPESLPSFAHVIDATEKVFQIPSHCGITFKLAVLTAWMSEMNTRGQLKKNIIDSPASPENSPASSESPISPPANMPA